MTKLRNWLQRNGMILIIVLLSLQFFNGCNQNTKISSLKKEVKEVRVTNDSMSNIIHKEIKTEGLRAELRMIQATDRKILDVQRENEIEKELKILGDDNGTNTKNN